MAAAVFRVEVARCGSGSGRPGFSARSPVVRPLGFRPVCLAGAMGVPPFFGGDPRPVQNHLGAIQQACDGPRLRGQQSPRKGKKENRRAGDKHQHHPNRRGHDRQAKADNAHAAAICTLFFDPLMFVSEPLADAVLFHGGQVPLHADQHEPKDLVSPEWFDEPPCRSPCEFPENVGRLLHNATTDNGARVNCCIRFLL